MRRVRLLLVAALAGTLATSALAAPGDPRARHTVAGQASAQSALVKRSDLPKGWTGSKVTETPGGSKLCKDVRPFQGDLVETGYAVAPRFNLGQTASVTQWVRTFRSAKQADTSWSRTVTIGLVSCLAKQLEAASTKKSRITVTGQYRLEVPKAAKRAAGFRVVAHVKADDTFDVYADVVVLEQGNRLAVMTFTGFRQPFDAALQSKLVRTVGARLGGKSAVA